MWSENKVRIKDIAEELGLSTATVSNVLHGKTQKISDRTVKAVEQKLEERGYIPDMAATLLAYYRRSGQRSPQVRRTRF